MSTHRESPLVLFCVLFCVSFCLVTSPLFAQLPPGAIVIEAESLTPENGAWVIREHWPNWYGGHPSNNKMLAGTSKAPGKAFTSFDLPLAGTYQLWVRHLDHEKRQGESDAFTITVSQNTNSQNDKTLCAETLNKASLRQTEEGKDR